MCGLCPENLRKNTNNGLTHANILLSFDIPITEQTKDVNSYRGRRQSRLALADRMAARHGFVHGSRCSHVQFT